MNTGTRITKDPRHDSAVGYYLDQDPARAPAQHILRFLERNAEGKNLLDFGCGIGAYSFELRRRGFRTTGVDANPEYVNIAKANGAEVILLSEAKLPFADKSFDTMFFIEVLEHLPDPVLRNILDEARRVTKFKILATVPNNTQYDQMSDHGFMYSHFDTVDHLQFFTVDSMSQLLGEHFSRIDVKEGDPIFPHRLLPPVVRRPISALYRMGLLQPTLYSRLFVQAWI